MIPLLASIGFLLSFYALLVKRKSIEKGYKPICDINKYVSCSKAFISTYGSLLGFHNAWGGVVLYTLVIAAYYADMQWLLKGVISISLLGSIVLLGILVKQRNACVVCILVYGVNVALAWQVF